MSLPITSAKFEQLLAAAPRERYAFFVEQAATEQEVWSLWKDSWALVGDGRGGIFSPFWPHRVFAQAYAVGEWEGYEPLPIGLGDFLTKWMPGLKEDQRDAAVFPVTTGAATISDPDTLRRDIEERLTASR